PFTSVWALVAAPMTRDASGPRFSRMTRATRTTEALTASATIISMTVKAQRPVPHWLLGISDRRGRRSARDIGAISPNAFRTKEHGVQHLTLVVLSRRTTVYNIVAA